MKTLKFIVFLALALILLVSALGCQPQQAGPVTVRVLTMEQAGPTVDDMNAIVAEFNKANPNVKVEIEYLTLRSQLNGIEFPKSSVSRLDSAYVQF